MILKVFIIIDLCLMVNYIKIYKNKFNYSLTVTSYLASLTFNM